MGSSNNRISGVTNNGALLATGITYKPFGGMTQISFLNGLSSNIGYDNLYQFQSINTGGSQSLGYTYTGDNITKITDNLNSTKTRSFTYDAHDQLHTATSGLWGTLTWDYDKVGNRLKETQGSIQNTYHYLPITNRLDSITGGMNAAYSYDANGNTSGENSRQFVYDQNQRLVRVVDGGVTKGEYVYNGLGQRVKKIANGVTTIFHYNLFGQIIAESDITHGTISDYVYLNGQPLAKIEGTNVYYYHNDHLGTPQKMTDSSGTVVWSADYKPFGEATITSLNGFTNNLRFPGQYYDSETDLHYNYYRDYNPATGRYVESDPIGILDGTNHLYSYVGNNPLNVLDLLGLEPVGGERGGTGGSCGQNTNNKYKHCRNHPTNPKKIICRHHQTGKEIVKEKPKDWPEEKEKGGGKSQADLVSEPGLGWVNPQIIGGGLIITGGALIIGDIILGGPTGEGIIPGIIFINRGSVAFGR